ncbi:MAG: PLP-dependent cysteine synthase family protein [Acidobacteria bacterium]|nr:PLP-dependent cysteine synthase family protein [Acidobacteriota bacterium]
MKSHTRDRGGATAVLDTIGNTPLIPLKRVWGGAPEVAVHAKAEWVNPGGSIKDRPALEMIEQGERSGKLEPGRILLDATSGNTGIAYAMIGAVRGIPVRLAMPENVTPERLKILRAYGAELVLTSGREGSDGAIRAAKRLYSENPDRYFYPDQYGNPANWQAHYHGTAVEIYRQTAGQVTHFVAGLGTSGTFVGTTRRLKEFNPAIECIAMQPDSPLHGLEGMKHMPSSIVPPIYDAGLADRHMEVSTEDAQEMVRRLAREEGLLVGISAGANVVAAVEIAKTLDAGVVVTVLCDGGMKYLNERFWGGGKGGH